MRHVLDCGDRRGSVEPDITYRRRQQIPSIFMIFGAAGDIGHMFWFDAHEGIRTGDEVVAIPPGARRFRHLLWEAGNLCSGLNSRSKGIENSVKEGDQSNVICRCLQISAAHGIT